MEVSAVRKRVLDAIEQSKKSAAHRRARNDQASRAFELFLEQTAVPLVRQVSSILRAEGYLFNVFTPGGSVRLMSERSAEDFIEIALDTSGADPVVMGHSSRSRGRRVIESLRPVAEGRDVESLTDDDLLGYLVTELAPFVER